MIATLNIWADVLATLMVLVVFGFWSFQVAGNLVTGRFYRKFVGRQWPHHDKPVALLPRLLHATHVAAMIALAFSGIYLRYPTFAGGRDLLRNIHYVAMYIVLINFVWRVYYAGAKDWLEFRITKQDIINAPKVMLYYAFITKSYPHLSKYNVMQKFTYGIAFPSLMVLQAVTGFALVWSEPLLGWTVPLTGGVAVTAAWLRLVHFMGCMSFIMLTGIHVCLAFVEDFPALLVFFGIKRQAGHEEPPPAPVKPAIKRPGMAAQ